MRTRSSTEQQDQNIQATPSIVIVILNWNGREDTLECLASVDQIDYPRYMVIVADNGSSDDSVKVIKDSHPNVHIIENGANLGFAAGNNSAIGYALDSSADFIFLLNNDTVVDPGILRAFVDAAERMPDVGVFGAKIYYFDRKDTLWFAGGQWDPMTLRFADNGANETDTGQFETLCETDWVIGCAMFVRADVFRTIGLLEPKFFLNYEEIDFCFRAIRSGFKCAYVPKARLWHKVSASFGGDESPLKVYFNERNRLLWAQRNTSLDDQLRLYLRATRVVINKFVRAVLGRTMGESFTLRGWYWALVSEHRNPINRALLRGYIDFWLRRFGDCPDSIRVMNRKWAVGRDAPRNGMEDRVAE